jgi:hypothetical protein
LALEHHPVLDGHGPAESLDPLQAAWSHGLGVIEKPASSGRPISGGGDLLEDGKVVLDGLVVGGVESEPPSIRNKEPGGGFEFAGGVLAEPGSGFGEVLVIRCRPGEVFAGTVASQPSVPVTGTDHPDPPFEVVELLAGSLGQQVVGDTHR